MEHRLADHLNSPDFTPNGQLIALGLRPAPDGDGVFVVLKIERCIDIAQAEWVARKVGADLSALIGAAPADEVVSKHRYQEPAGSGWTAAIGVELADRDNAEAFAKVVAAYADAGADAPLN